jgi:hypothetical protein
MNLLEIFKTELEHGVEVLLQKPNFSVGLALAPM